ncbi:MAG: amino acid adenylation domain-containing protein [Pseudonocardiaceae bacterium]
MVAHSDSRAEPEIPLLSSMLRLAERTEQVERLGRSLLVRHAGGIDHAVLLAAVDVVVRQHPALRCVLSRPVPSIWSLEPGDAVPASALVQVLDHPAGDEHERLARAVDAATGRLCPDEGILFQVVALHEARTAQSELLLVLHELIADERSLEILAEDLTAAYDLISTGDPAAGEVPAQLPERMALRDCAEHYLDLAREPVAEHERQRWRETLTPAAEGGLPGADISRPARHRWCHSHSSTAADVRAAVRAAERVSLAEVVLAVVSRAFAHSDLVKGAESTDLLIDLERDQRVSHLDADRIRRTVAPLTATVPLRLPVVGDLTEAYAAVADAVRSAVQPGERFELHRYLDPRVAAEFGRLANPRILVAVHPAPQPRLAEGWVVRHRVGRGRAMAAVPGYDLVLDIYESATPGAEGLDLRLSYPDGAADESALDRFVDCWVAALGHAQRLAGSGALDLGLLPGDLDLVDLDWKEIRSVEATAPCRVADIWPLSPLQEGLYFHSVFDRSSVAYTAQFALDLGHRMDAERMRVACLTFMARNPTLRAGFTNDGLREPVQFIAAGLEAPLTEIDLTALPVQEREARAEQLMAEDRATPFEVTRPPLWRLTMLHLGESHTRLVVNRQFLLWDGGSGQLVVGQLLDLYERGGDDSDLPAVRGSYHDYLVWITERDTEAAKAAWRHALSGLEEPTLAAPSVRGAEPVAPGRCSVELPEPASAALRAAAQRHGVTLNTVLNTALALVLSSAVGRDDIVFGSTVAGRPPEVPGLDEVIGLFLNTVPVRVTLNPAETVLDLFRRVQSGRADLMEHEHLSLSAIQHTSGHAQLFDVLYVLQNFIDEASTERMYAAHGILGETSLDHTHYPLTFVVFPGTRISVRLEYRTDVLGENEAESLLSRFVRLLDLLVEDVSRVVGAVPVLSAAERAAITADWSGAADPVGRDTVADLLGAQAGATPDEVALVFGTEQLSYGELDRRVNQLARLLLGRGAGPERVVALALPRSLDMVVALFAVLRTGAAYLPLELDHPPQRLVGILSDAAPVVLVSGTAIAGDLAGSGVPTVLLDEPAVRAELTALRADPLDDDELGLFAGNRDGRLEHPAYVIYTSGSTGRPKGVLTPYRGLTNMQINHRREIFGPAVAAAGGRRLRIAHTVSFAFDMSWEELLWLIEGHEVHVCDEELRRDADALVAYCDAHRIDVINVTPTYAHHLFEAGLLDTAGGGHRPVLVMLGGEAVSDAVWNRLCDTEDTIGYNLYGPTEYTINTLGGGTLDSSTPTVGRPICNTHARGLDARLGPAPRGVPGELYIAGIGLARGYLDQPALTAERFVADPYGPPGSRMYRTGDLVRSRPDQMLDFLGRTDTQVKIRGYRVELGEIESALTAYPGVTQAAVIADHAQPSRAGRLVGYVVGAPVDPAERDRVEREQIGEWQQIYDTGYTQLDAALTENFAGWDSSYDGTPIPPEHMREWRDSAVERIRGLGPRRVLEIGVGSGLLLSRLAPDCDCYWGTDFSAPVIDRLRVDLAHGAAAGWQVELACQPAHVVDGLPVGFFDTVVVNSVVQYFPGVDYLTDVLRKAMSLVRPGGAVFIGDVRNLRLARCFHTGVQLARAGTEAGTDALRRAVERNVRLERELMIDPEYFAQLPEHLPGVDGVDIRLKRGWSHNELTRHRYDVILHKAPAEAVPLADAPRLAWGDQVPDVEALAEFLTRRRHSRLRMCGIPNPRLTAEATALRVLDSGGEIADIPPEPNHLGGVEPETMHELGRRLGYQVLTTWSDAAEDSYDAVFLAVQKTGVRALTGGYAGGGRPRALAECANDPIAARQDDAFGSQLREHLTERLPDYMVPAALMVVDQLPLTVNGKLDVKALPVPDLTPSAPSRAPQSPKEQLLCALFAEVLGLDQVGVDDDFFTLGGDSIISIQLTSRARKVGVQISPRDVFERRTVAALAAVAAAAEAAEDPAAAAEEPDAGIGPVPLTPVMRWLLDRGGPVDGYAMALVVQTPAGLGHERLTRLWQAVLDRHDLLRARFDPPVDEGKGWTLQVEPAGSAVAEPCVRRVDAAGLDDEALRQLVNAEEDAAVARLALGTGVTTQLVWFDCGPTRPGRLLVLIHHLVVDGVSWRILVEDLALGWAQLADGGPVELEPARTSFRHWAQRWVTKAQDPARVTELPLWTTALDGGDALLSERPLDPARDTWGTRGELTLVLPSSAEPLLTSVPALFHGGVDDVLLTALALAVGQWRRCRGQPDQRHVVVDLEGHGRQEQLVGSVDLTRTVGWFTSIFPVRLDIGEVDLDEALAGGAAAGRALKRIKEQLRAVPDHGLGFGLLRYLNPETATVLAGLPAAQIMFNYLGRFAISDTADWSIVPDCGQGGGAVPGLPMSHPLHINAWTEDRPGGRQLRASWAWPTGLFTEEAVRELAEGWFRALEALAEHAGTPSAGGHTPSDMRLVSVSQDDIDELEAEWAT